MDTYFVILEFHLQAGFEDAALIPLSHFPTFPLLTFRFVEFRVLEKYIK